MKIRDWLWRYSYFYVLEGKFPPDVFNDGIEHRMQVNGITSIHFRILNPAMLKPLTDYLCAVAKDQHSGFGETVNHRLVYYSYLGSEFILFRLIKIKIKNFFAKEKVGVK